VTERSVGEPPLEPHESAEDAAFGEWRANATERNGIHVWCWECGEGIRPIDLRAHWYDRHRHVEDPDREE